MRNQTAIARALSAVFLAGTLDVDAMVDRSSQLLGKRWRWLRPLARRVCMVFANQTRPREISVTQFILNDTGFLRAWGLYDLSLPNLVIAPHQMYPRAAQSWQIPSIPSSGELARWLGVTLGELDWFADLWSLEFKRNQGRLRHYHYRPLTKRFGQVRLIEAPKPRLKDIQSRILSDILEHIPPHIATHGFRRGRSIKTFAAPHVGKQVVLKIDLQDFFPSISVARIHSLFRTVGYPERVANLLAGLCTNTTPSDIWEDERGNSWGESITTGRAGSMRKAPKRGPMVRG